MLDFFKQIKEKQEPALKMRGLPPGQKESGNIIYIIIIAVLILVILLMVLTYRPNLLKMPGELVNSFLAFKPFERGASLLGADMPAGGISAPDGSTTTPADISVPSTEIIVPAAATASTDIAASPTDIIAPTDAVVPLAATTTAAAGALPADAAIPPAENIITTPPPQQPVVQQNIPVVQNAPVVTKVTSPILFGNFKSGVIPIMVFFDRAITVSGKPQLILSTGSPSTTAVGYKYSFNNYLFFQYRIAPGNYSQDLDYSSSSALVLNGGEIKDKFGNAANLALPEPGSPGSLSGSSNIVIGSPK